jgi:hypothetical protein
LAQHLQHAGAELRELAQEEDTPIRRTRHIGDFSRWKEHDIKGIDTGVFKTGW